MFNILFPINEKSIRFLQKHGYKLDPTHVYWYKKLSDDIEIEIQNCANDLYKKGQIILHCQRACIIDDLTELQYIILNSVYDTSYSYLLYENERLNKIIDEYEDSDKDDL